MAGDTVMEATPVVVDGVMYMAGPPGDVAAFDARSGLQIWRFHRRQDVKNPYQINPFNKGVAVLDGRVFFGTLDNKLIALDAHNGRELWEETINDTMSGYTITGAPLALKDKLIVGMSGGEMGVRGYLEAYDPATGKKLWRFYTVPAPGEPGGDTWAGDSWKYGGGPTWLTGSYDPQTNSLIWGVGNPGPDFNPDLRKGDNLYTDSVLSLDADTGKLNWYYQFTPNDGHDWDSTEDMVLADQVIDGQPRKLVLHADRNGMFYVLDRTDGKFLWAKPFVRQTWNLGFDQNGRPIVDPKSVPTRTGQVVFPGSGTNFAAPSYDKDSGRFYLAFHDAQGFAISAPAVYERGKQYVGRGVGSPPVSIPPVQGIEAIDSHTGAIVWKVYTAQDSAAAGVLGTRGGLVFAATGEGEFVALDAGTGKILWSFRTGVPITASPISYAVDGRQFIAIAAGNMVYSFALPKGN
jgi:alcohol dehydrogenase (cytochrome c)